MRKKGGRREEQKEMGRRRCKRSGDGGEMKEWEE